jgi:CubicO group peptidase (beta-lactamase class C family)
MTAEQEGRYPTQSSNGLHANGQRLSPDRDLSKPSLGILADDDQFDFVAWSMRHELGNSYRHKRSQFTWQQGPVDILLAEAARNQTCALIISRAGQIVVEEDFGFSDEPVESMSITKSIASLAFGVLIESHPMITLDTPLSMWLPDFREGPKSLITVRHILTHTSGLVLRGDRCGEKREYEIVRSPGERFEYSNDAIEILSDLAVNVSGTSLAALAQEKVLEPLGISEWTWQQDERGNHPLAYGLALRASDLARIGRMMLQDGEWNGRAVVPSSWIRRVTAAGHFKNPFYGLLWYLRGDRQGGTRLDKRHGPNVWHSRLGAFYAHGWLGQYLLVYPDAEVVAVRLHRQMFEGGEEENSQHGFPGFIDAIDRVIGS